MRSVAPSRLQPQSRPLGSRPAVASRHQQVASRRPVARRSLPSLDMSLPGAEALIKQQPVVRRRKFYRLRTWAFRSVVTSLVLVIGLGGILFAQGYFKLNKVFKGGATAAALQKDVNPNKLKGEGDGRINILLMGVGGDENDAPDLTDTLMLASIDPVNKTASLLSLPRDMWVNIPNVGKMKLNAAYETGKYRYQGKIDHSNADYRAVSAGFTMVDQTIEDITGVTVHYNVLLNYHAFRRAIDTVGGVDINVPEQLYDPTMAWENGWNPVLAKAGPQHMDSKRALNYARSRHTSSDFARSQRQRALMLALKEKVVSLGTLGNPMKISELMSAFGDNVKTDLSLSDTVALYSIMKDIDNKNVGSLGLADNGNSFITTDNMNGQSVVRPKLGYFNYTDIRSYVRRSLQDGFIKKENARITVLNGTSFEGLATRDGDLLKTYGYNVTKVDNAPTQVYDTTVIVDLSQGKAKYTRHYLEQRFQVKATTKIPDSAILPGDSDFIIILGHDEATRSED
jgi:LCP family protein required for cell wall assembly